MRDQRRRQDVSGLPDRLDAPGAPPLRNETFPFRETLARTRPGRRTVVEPEKTVAIATDDYPLEITDMSFDPPAERIKIVQRYALPGCITSPSGWRVATAGPSIRTSRTW
jgi:hypothetical protein